VQVDETPAVDSLDPAEVKAKHAAPVSVRIDKTLVQGDTVALLAENVWTLRGEGDSQQKRVQTIAAFYALKDGKIAHIVRLTDRVGRAQT
jgi:hypothetical protein